MNKLVIASAFTLAAFSASAQLYGEIGVTSIKIECPSSNGLRQMG